MQVDFCQHQICSDVEAIPSFCSAQASKQFWLDWYSCPHHSRPQTQSHMACPCSKTAFMIKQHSCISPWVSASGAEQDGLFTLHVYGDWGKLKTMLPLPEARHFPAPYLLLAAWASRNTSMERLGVRMRVMASSTAVRTAVETRVKEPSFLPTNVVATDSHSLQGITHRTITKCTLNPSCG